MFTFPRWLFINERKMETEEKTNGNVKENEE
jgi:hypothetical protein